MTASVQYNRPLQKGNWASLLLWGRNEDVAGGNVAELKVRLRKQFSFLFDVDDETPNDTFQGTMSQALMLLNGLLVSGGSSDIPGTALADVLAADGTEADKIEALYLRTLSRKPTSAEVTQWTQFVNEPRDVTKQRPNPAQPAPARGGKKGKAQGAGKKGPGEPLGRFGGRIPTVARTAKDQAFEDVFWALLNSSEFFFNH